MKKKISMILAASLSTGIVAAAAIVPTLSSVVPANVIVASASYDGYFTGYKNVVDDAGETWNIKMNRNNEGIIICKYLGDSEDLVIPSELTFENDGVEYTFPVTALFQRSIENKKNIKTITIPESVTEIGSYVFENLPGLTDVTIPDTVEKLAIKAFDNCVNLRNINIPASINEISCFVKCPSLETINNKPIAYYDTETDQVVLCDQIKAMIANDKLDEAEKIPSVREAVSQYIKHIVETETDDSMNDAQKAHKLINWVNSKVPYDHDEYPVGNTKENNHCDYTVFLNNTAVCDGYARAYDILLHDAGIESYYVSSGKYYDDTTNDDVSHAFNILKLGGRYYLADPTANAFMYDYNKYNINSNFTSPDKWTINKVSELHDSSNMYIPAKVKNFLGDLDGDGYFTRNDTNQLRRALNGEIELTEQATIYVDYNFDGQITEEDVKFWENRIYREELLQELKKQNKVK